jgi:serine/threonine-protein kinase RsbW
MEVAVHSRQEHIMIGISQGKKTQRKPRTEIRPQYGGHVETLSTRHEIPNVIASIVERMADHHYSEKEQFAVHLALEEALVNAVRHGNRNDPAKAVQVSFLVHPERVLIEVQDEGSGFDPAVVPDPLAPENLERSTGRGLHLIRTYMTWLRFNSKGNCLTMCKCRPFPTGLNKEF